MYNPIQIIDYDKLSDDLYFLGKYTSLKFNVILNSKNSDKTRRNYHQEFSYNSNKYIDVKKLHSLKRQYRFYYSIESNMDNEKIFIMIHPENMRQVINKLNKVFEWFESDKFKNLFALDKDKLIRLDRPEPVIIERLAMDMKIAFEPIVIEYENSMYEGVRMYLNSKNSYVDLPVQKLSGLLYILENTNMVNAAQSMITYNGRPALGENSYDINSGKHQNNNQEDMSRVSTGKKRQIPGTYNKKRSIFDNID